MGHISIKHSALIMSYNSHQWNEPEHWSYIQQPRTAQSSSSDNCSPYSSTSDLLSSSPSSHSWASGAAPFDVSPVTAWAAHRKSLMLFYTAEINLIYLRSVDSPQSHHYHALQLSIPPIPCASQSAWRVPRRLPPYGDHLPILHDPSPVQRVDVEAHARDGAARPEHWPIYLGGAPHRAPGPQGRSCIFVPHMRRAICKTRSRFDSSAPQALGPPPLRLSRTLRRG